MSSFIIKPYIPNNLYILLNILLGNLFQFSQHTKRPLIQHFLAQNSIQFFAIFFNAELDLKLHMKSNLDINTVQTLNIFAKVRETRELC